MVRAPRRLKSLASLVVGLAVALAGLVAIPAAGAAGAPQKAPADAAPQWRDLPPYDSRTADGSAAAPTAGQSVARADLASSLGSQGGLDIDALTGTPRVGAKLDGYLTGRSGRAPSTIALDYVRANLTAFGLTTADLATLRLVRDYEDIRGTHHLYWQQLSEG